MKLVDDLGLEDLIVMGHDSGGPIGMRVALNREARVAGIVLGNTWFWRPHLLSTRMFGRIMSSPPLRWVILKRNLLVERVIPAGTGRKLTEEEMDHFRGVQPTPEARVALTQTHREIHAARPFLAELATEILARLGDRKALLGGCEIPGSRRRHLCPACKPCSKMSLWLNSLRRNSSFKKTHRRTSPRQSSSDSDD